MAEGRLRSRATDDMIIQTSLTPASALAALIEARRALTGSNHEAALDKLIDAVLVYIADDGDIRTSAVKDARIPRKSFNVALLTTHKQSLECPRGKNIEWS